MKERKKKGVRKGRRGEMGGRKVRMDIIINFSEWELWERLYEMKVTERIERK